MASLRVLLFAALSLSCAGCARTRYATPWLRTNFVPAAVTIIAESGGNPESRTTERFFEGRWMVIADGYAEAMATRGGACAVYRDEHGYVLTNERGEARPIRCEGHVREASLHDAIDCVELDLRDVVKGEPKRVVWRRFDHDMQIVVEQSIPFEERQFPPGASFDFIGSAPDDGPVVVVHSEGNGDDGLSRARCTLYELTTDGLARMESIDTYDWRMCSLANFWSDRGVEVRTSNSPISE